MNKSIPQITLLNIIHEKTALNMKMLYNLQWNKVNINEEMVEIEVNGQVFLFNEAEDVNLFQQYRNDVPSANRFFFTLHNKKSNKYMKARRGIRLLLRNLPL